MPRYRALQDIHHGKRYGKGDTLETTAEAAAEPLARGWLEPVDRTTRLERLPKSSKLENPGVPWPPEESKSPQKKTNVAKPKAAK